MVGRAYAKAKEINTRPTVTDKSKRLFGQAAATSLISSPLFDDHRHFVRGGPVIAHAVIMVLHCQGYDALLDAIGFNVPEVLRSR